MGEEERVKGEHKLWGRPIWPSELQKKSWSRISHQSSFTEPWSVFVSGPRGGFLQQRQSWMYWQLKNVPQQHIQLCAKYLSMKKESSNGKLCSAYISSSCAILWTDLFLSTLLNCNAFYFILSIKKSLLFNKTYSNYSIKQKKIKLLKKSFIK